MSRIHLIMVGIAILSLSVSVSAQVQPSETPHQEHHAAATSEATQKGDMMSRCREMMAQQQQMVERKKQMSAKLDALVRDMNQAKSKDQTAKIIAVINEMVTQRQTMDELTTMMQQQMMMHAMDHAQSGMRMECPMMKQMQEKMNPAGSGKP